MKILLISLLVLVFTLYTGDLSAATITSTAAGGTWATTGTWVGGVVPVAADAVVIATTGLGVVTIGAATTCASLTINTGSILTVNRNLTVTGATSITGRVNFGSSNAVVRTMTFTGAVTLNSGAFWNETNVNAIPAFSFGNSFTNNSTTFTTLTGAHTFTGAAMTLSGATAILIPNVAISGSYTNTGTLTVSTALTGAGSLTNGASGVLNLGGTSTITTLTAKAISNAVNYTGAAQTIKITHYNNLSLSGSGTKTFGATTNISGGLSISGTAVANLATFAFTATSLTLGGVSQSPGTWGGTGSGATNINTTYFFAATGLLTVNSSFNSWTGTTSTDWNVATNWSALAVPLSSHSVIINSGGNQPSIGATGSGFVCNNITIYTGAILIISGTNTLTISGNWINNGTFTANSSVVDFVGTSKTVGTGPFFNLTTSGTASITTTAIITITGSLNIGSGTSFTTGATNSWTLTVPGTTNVSGTLNLANTGNKTFTGAVTLNSGAVWNETGIAAFSFANNLTNNGTTFTANTGIHTFSGALRTIGGSSVISIPSVAITGTYTNVNTLSVGTALSGAGSLTNGAATGVLNLGGTITLTTLIATASGNVINYNGAVQTIKTTNYNNLSLSGTGNKTFGAIINIISNLEISSSSSQANLGTFTSNSGTLTLAGVSQASGSWGGTGSGATNINTIYFANATGKIIVSPFNTWTGATNTDWNTPGNWSSGIIPTTGLSVVIPSVANQPTIGAAAVCNDITINAGATLTISGSNSLAVSGSWIRNGTFTANTSTVTFNGTGKTLGAGPFYNLTTSGSSTITSNAAIAVTGNLTVAAGTSFSTGTTNTWTLSVTGTTIVAGSLVLANTGAKTFTGNVTINPGGIWNETGIAAIGLAGNLQNDGAAFTANTGIHTFSGAAKTITGATLLSISRVTISGTYTNSTTLTIATTLAGAGTLTNAATGILNLGGTSAITTLTAVAVGNRVNYTGGAQTSKVTTYYNLTLSGSGVKTFATTPTVNNILSMEGTATVTVTGAGAITYGANASLQYNTATARTATTEEWITPFAATGGIIIANAGVITMGGAKVLNATSPLTINTGASLTTGATNAWTLTVGASTIISGTLTLANTGVKNFTGNVTINALGIWNETGVAAIGFAGNLLNNGATFTANTGIHTFSGTAKTIGGSSAISIPSVSVTGTYTSSGTITVGTALTGAGSLTNTATGVLNIGGTSTITTLIATASGNTVNYTGALQTVKPTTFFNLTLAGSGTKTTTGITVNGLFSREGTAAVSAAPTYGASATLQYKGSAAQTTGPEFPASWTGSGGLKIENANGVTLNAIKNINSTPFTIGGTIPNSVFSDGGFQLTGTGTLNLTSGTLVLGLAASATTFPGFGTNNIAAGTTVEYAASNTQTIKGLTYSNLTISGTGTNSKVASANITVNGTLNLVSANASATQGCLEMGAFTLTMGASSTTIGTGDVTGIVTRNSISTGTPYTFGNQFTTIDFSAGGSLPSSMSVKIILSTSHAFKANAIHRYYDIIRTGGNSATKVTLRLHYLVSELNGSTESILDLFDFTVSGSTLVDDGVSNLNNTNKWAELSNLSLTYVATGGSFTSKYWTLGNSIAPTHTWLGITSSDWTDVSNWNPAVVPVSTDHVLIPDAATTSNDPTLISTTIVSLIIQSGGILNGGTGIALTLTGGAGTWNNSGTFIPGTSNVLFSGASATMAGISSFYDVTINNGAILTLGTDNVMRIENALTLSGTAVLNAAVNVNTIEYNGSDDQLIAFPNGSTTGYYNIILSGSGNKTFPAFAMIVYGDFTLNDAATGIASQSLTVIGNVVLGSGTTFDVSTFSHVVSGNWTNNGSILIPGSSIITFNNTSVGQAINGTSVSQTFNAISVAKTAQTLSIGGSTTSLTLNGSLTITSGTFNAGTAAIINLAGNWVNTGTFTAGSGTVVFNGSTAQTISNINTFNNFTANNAAGVTANSNQFVNGILNLQGTNASQTQGCLHMSDPSELIMGSLATTSGTGDVTGIVTHSDFNLNIPYSFGNQFTTINFSVGPLPTSVSFKIILTASEPGFMTTTEGINRYYDIKQVGADVAARVFLNLHYLNSELGSAVENNLVLFDDHVLSGSLVHDHGRSNRSTTDKWVGLSNVGLFFLAGANFDERYWTLGTSITGNSKTWIGGSGSGASDWNIPGNWDGGVPADTSDVIIPDVTNNPTLPLNSIIGSLSIQIGGVVNDTTGGTTLIITGGAGAWNNLGTFNAGESLVTFTGIAATMAGSTDFNNVTVENGAVLSLGTNNIMRIGGFLSLSSTGVLNAAINSNTIEFNGTSQTIPFPNGSTIGYHNLVLSGSGTKTLPAIPLHILSDFSLSGSASATASADITIDGAISIGSGTTLDASTFIINIAGNWSNLGTFTASTGTLIFNGASPQTISGTSTFNDLSITGSGGVLAAASFTVNGVLNLAAANPSATKGLLEMTNSYGTYPGTTNSDYLNSYILSMGASASTTGVGDVTGTVKRTTIVANTVYTFGNQYTTIALTTGTMPTDLSVTITIGSTAPGKADAIKRTYEIVPTGGDNCLVAANFHYLDSELQSSINPFFTNTETKMVTWDYDIGGGSATPDEHGRSAYDFTSNFVGLSNIPISYFINTAGHAWRTIFTLGDFAVGYYTWDGSSDNVWGTSTNWTPAGNPTGLSHVIIPDAATTPNDPVLPAGSTTINTLTIENGGVLTMGANTLIIANTLSGGWEDQNPLGNDPGTSTVIFSASGTSISGNARFYNAEIGNGADITNQASSTMKIANSIIKTGTGNWYADVYNNSIDYNGSAQTVILSDGATEGYHNLLLSGSGVKTMPGSAMTIYGDFTISGTASVTAGAAIAVVGNITLGSGTTFAAGTFTHQVSGNWTNNGATYTPGSSTINFNNTIIPQLINGTASGQTFNAISVNKTAQTLSVGASTTSLTLNSGLTITSGVFDAGTATSIILSGGNWSNGGAFTPGSSTVSFTGSPAQTISGVNTFNNLTLNNSSGVTAGNNQIVNGVLNLLSANASATQGCLEMTNPYELTMGATATSTGPGDVTGIVTRLSFTLNTPYSFGNQFTTMNFSLGPLPTSVSFKIILSASHTWKNDAINRYYDIIRAGGSSATRLTLNLHYLDTELNAATETNLDFFDNVVSGPTVIDRGRSNRSLSDNWVGLSGLGLPYVANTVFDYKYWTLGNNIAGNTHTWISGGAVLTDWTLPGNWNGGVPNDTSDVKIPGIVVSGTADNPILPLSTTIKTLEIQSGGVLNAAGSPTLTIAGGAGAWSNIGTFNAATSTVVFTNDAATISDVTNFYNVTIADGAILSPGTNNIMRIAGTLSLSASGVLTAANTDNTIEYNGTNQTVILPNGTTSGYHSLVLSNSGTKTMPGTAMALYGDLSLSGTVSATALNILDISGNVILGSGTAFNAGTFTHLVSGNWTNNGGTFTPGTSVIDFVSITDPQSINGSASGQTFNSISVKKTSQILSIAGTTTTLTVNSDLTITSGTLDAGTASNINVSGNWDNNGTFIAGSGNVNINGSIPQTINGTSAFYNLNLSGSNAKTLPGTTLTINGDFSISGTATTSVPGIMNISGNATIGPGTTVTIDTSGDLNVGGNLSIDTGGTLTVN